MEEAERERRRRFLRERREFKRLLEQSSLAEDKLWVQCPKHSRQARDPLTQKCIRCQTE